MTLPIRLGIPLVFEALLFIPIFLKQKEKSLKTSTEVKVKELFTPFLKEQGVRDDVLFVEQKNAGVFSASGINIKSIGTPVIQMNPGSYEIDPDAAHFVLKHEIAHIKHNDFLIKKLASVVASVAAVVFGFALSLGFLPLLATTIAIVAAVTLPISQWRERKADDFAIKNSSAEELKGGRRFFKAFQEVNKGKRKNFISKLLYSKTGEPRLALTHPSFASRIKKIELELATRGIAIDDQIEGPLVEKLQKHFQGGK